MSDLEDRLCRWWVYCGRVAVTTRDSGIPTLGAVPICRRCDDAVAAIGATSADTVGGPYTAAQRATAGLEEMETARQRRYDSQQTDKTQVWRRTEPGDIAEFIGEDA